MLQGSLNDNSASREAAEELANKIRAFWEARGELPTVYVYKDAQFRGSVPLFCVRSDIRLTTHPVPAKAVTRG